MNILDVIGELNRMRDEGIIDTYAIGGAVAATFYLEPIATLDVDVFVALQPAEGSAILDPRPIFRYLNGRGYPMQGEYVMVGAWPVQILVPAGPLVDEALEQAVMVDIGGMAARVFTAEHLAAICLQIARAKDKARLLQFLEEDALDRSRFEEILSRHGLTTAWEKYRAQFLEET